MSANVRARLARAATATKALVYAELCQIVEEWLELFKRDGKPLPPPTANRQIAKSPKKFRT
ncbi:MAG: hypothetical protein MZV65_01910 [Chromatiales bacterium]|nr:hypothetical protein [Chromatiales bacterium]